MDRELSQGLMEPVGGGGIPARFGSKSSMILKIIAYEKMCVLGAVRESRIFRPVLPASGSLSARGEILDHKTSAQHKFLGVKINP